MQEDVVDLQQRNDGLRRENRRLVERARALHTDVQLRDELSTRRFDLLRPNEVRVRFVSSGDIQAAPAQL
jgi:cell division protein FtsB